MFSERYRATVQYCTLHFSVALYSTIQHCTVQYSTVQQLWRDTEKPRSPALIFCFSSEYSSFPVLSQRKYARTVHYSTLQYSTGQYSALLQYTTALYSTLCFSSEYSSFPLLSQRRYAFTWMRCSGSTMDAGSREAVDAGMLTWKLPSWNLYLRVASPGIGKKHRGSPGGSSGTENGVQ